MMRKMISMLLCVVLVATLAIPVCAADESQEARLQAVTVKVKEQLSIDTQKYTKFSGELNEGALKNTWYLRWTDDDEAFLAVRTAEDGTIFDFYRWDMEDWEDTNLSSSYNPKFPQEDAVYRQSVQAFLDRVLGTGESALFDVDTGFYVYGTSNRYQNYIGTILLNGLPSPFDFSVQVRLSDGVVNSFYRSMSDEYTGDVPTSTPVVTAAQATPKLSSVNTFSLEYVLDADADKAVLRYLPTQEDAYYVDAQSGALVNVSVRSRELGAYYYNSRTAYSMQESALAVGGAYDDAEVGLTEVELTGAEELKDVLSAQTLERKLRDNYPALQLDGLTCANTRFTRSNAESGAVHATLTMAGTQGGGQVTYMICMDGKTGALQSLYAYRDYYDSGYVCNVSLAEGEEIATAFLTTVNQNAAQQMVLVKGEVPDNEYSAAHTYTFFRQVNGYLFRQNTYTVGVDTETGAVCALSGSFDSAAQFDSPSGLILEQVAGEKYAAAQEATLGYIGVPFAIDSSMEAYQRLIRWEQNYLYRLTLAYTATWKGSAVTGVDAKTGALVMAQDEAELALHYSDIEGSAAQSQIEALGALGIGYLGGLFQPEQNLTQMDCISLMLSAVDGGPIALESETNVTDLYRRAYAFGMLTVAERDDNKVLTREEMVKILLSAAGYGKAAQLQGIYTCSFADADSVSDALLGYVAIAQGMGIITPDASGKFYPTQEATRADAAVLIYNLMCLS
ncbi:MAG: S-layer homology domain-containing protein [Oscillospiraceae bacterium]|nr:S-layer homology domain-containing protein [Oscillospiraceae bacterium]